MRVTNSTITSELLELLANYPKLEDLAGEDWLFKQLRKAVMEWALGAELLQRREPGHAQASFGFSMIASETGRAST
jgi:hypothetical protein